MQKLLDEVLKPSAAACWHKNQSTWIVCRKLITSEAWTLKAKKPQFLSGYYSIIRKRIALNTYNWQCVFANNIYICLNNSDLVHT